MLNFFRKPQHLFLLLLVLIVTACNMHSSSEETVITNVANNNTPSNFTVLPQQNPYMLRTTFRANDLDLETPLRCNVNWKTQEMVQILPHNNVSFKLERNDVNDTLPDFEVRDFTFDNVSADQALLTLTKEAGITLVAKDAPYPLLYGKELSGSFKEVVDKISSSADLFYR